MKTYNNVLGGGGEGGRVEFDRGGGGGEKCPDLNILHNIICRHGGTINYAGEKSSI